MTALKLKYLARSRLWADVVLSHGDRLFVPTVENLGPGVGVAVEIEAPELAAALKIQGVVQEVRPFDGHAPAGVYVQVDSASIEACRNALGVKRSESARTAGRSESRADCEFPARILGPGERQEVVVKSLSAQGLTLKTSSSFPQEAPLTISILLPDGPEAMVQARVAWSRQELALVGVRITQLEGNAQEHISAAVKLLAARSLRTTPVQTGTVLIADDDPTILDFTSRIVMKAGHRVVRAERGDVALEMVRKEKPGLVLLDVLMPGLDGLEVCRSIRADAAFAQLPVVLLSAMGEQRLSEAAREVGATAWLTKPMRIDSVRALLDTYVGSPFGSTDTTK